MASETENYEGGCTCRQVRYRLRSKPLFVHCCHCRWCQRETGTAFALNAMIEADRVEVLAGEVEIVQRGRVVDPSTAKGAILIRRRDPR